MDLIGDARFALRGEASHGTHEFYRKRAQLTKRLIEEKGFTAVAVEAGWPDAYRVNCYVRGLSDDADAIEALADLRRFPAWMWRNTEVVEFVERRCRRGTCETVIWSRRSTRSTRTSLGRAGARRSSSERTIRTSAMRGQRRWTSAAS